MSRPAFVALVFAALALGSTPHAHAQTPPPPPPPLATPAPPEAGDVVWTFAQEPPLFDERVAMALGALMSSRLPASSTPRIVQVSQRGPDFAPTGVAPADQVPLLLAAAGFGQTPPFIEVGQCRVWAAPPPVGTGPTTLPAAFEARPRLIAALGGALTSLGVQARACVATDRVEDAHILVWQQGQPAPALAQRNQPTFLSYEGFVPIPTAPSSPPSGAPRPAATGSAGPTGETSDRGGAVVAVVIVAAMITTGRLATRRWRAR